jgi:predicted helicase
MEKNAQIFKADDWKSFEQSLEQLGKTEKGRAFEELARLYLLTEPTFSSKITKIWHHSETPQLVLDELGLERRDVGVDLVAKVKDGMYWAIQCKFHQDRSKKHSAYRAIRSGTGNCEPCVKMLDARLEQRNLEKQIDSGKS